MGFPALVGLISSAEIRLPGMSVSLTEQIAEVIHKYRLFFLKRILFLFEKHGVKSQMVFLQNASEAVKLGKLRLGSPQTSTASLTAPQICMIMRPQDMNPSPQGLVGADETVIL